MSDQDIDPDAWLDAERDAQHEDALREAHEREVRMRHIGREVLDEAQRSIAKHGAQDHVVVGTGSHTMPLARIDASAGTSVARRLAERAKRATDAAAERGDVTWVAILLEEVFEAIAEDDPFAVRAELVQVAAVAVKMIDRIDVERERLARLDPQSSRTLGSSETEGSDR
jgi:hypothetical protein